MYRFGSRTNNNLTPRPGKDTAGAPGCPGGLSVEESLNPDGKCQVIETSLLPSVLQYLSDVPSTGRAGHGVIAPVRPDGGLDMDALVAWADSRGQEQNHPFTIALLDAIIGEERGRP